MQALRKMIMQRGGVPGGVEGDDNSEEDYEDEDEHVSCHTVVFQPGPALVVLGAGDFWPCLVQRPAVQQTCAASPGS